MPLMNKEVGMITLPGVALCDLPHTSAEQKDLSAVTADLGNNIAKKLQVLAGAAKLKNDFVIWRWSGADGFQREHANDPVEMFGMYLKADDFFIESIIFEVHSSTIPGGSELVVRGGSNIKGVFQCDEGEMRVLMDKSGSGLNYHDTLFLKKYGHGLGDFGVFDLEPPEKLQILNIADRITDVFLKMSVIN
jgi:hypothetical protein